MCISLDGSGGTRTPNLPGQNRTLCCLSYGSPTDPSGVCTRFAGLKGQPLNCIEQWAIRPARGADPPGRSRTYPVLADVRVTAGVGSLPTYRRRRLAEANPRSPRPELHRVLLITSQARHSLRFEGRRRSSERSPGDLHPMPIWHHELSRPGRRAGPVQSPSERSTRESHPVLRGCNPTSYSLTRGPDEDGQQRSRTPTLREQGRSH